MRTRTAVRRACACILMVASLLVFPSAAMAARASGYARSWSPEGSARLSGTTKFAIRDYTTGRSLTCYSSNRRTKYSSTMKTTGGPYVSRNQFVRILKSKGRSVGIAWEWRKRANGSRYRYITRIQRAADPLAGTWSSDYLADTFPADLEGNRTGPGTWRAPETRTPFVIRQRGGGYTVPVSSDGTSVVTFDGRRVTVELSFPVTPLRREPVLSRFEGVLEGDAVVGTQHLVVGPDVYDGPWAGKRME